MPTFKGIRISVISQHELRVHPEFPHPDTTRLVNNAHDATEHTDTSDDSLSTPRSIKADKILGIEEPSIVSCYIPSMSGTRFWLRYGIIEAAKLEAPWYYFKLYINGRHITSWGTNTKTKPNGQVMRALFDPSERWNSNHKGAVYKDNRTEVRNFFFGNEDKYRSAATDGGLIEIAVFRAYGRRRKLAAPGEFKVQDGYGIVIPTNGLFVEPQDAKFYDYHLQDSKDKPFASFRIHYRSWQTLKSQHLIPSNHPEELLLTSPSLLSLNGSPKEFVSQVLYPTIDVESPILVDKLETGGPKERRETGDSMSSSNTTSPWMTTIFDDSPQRSASKHVFHIRNGSIPTSKFREQISRPLPQPDFDNGLEAKRPLPENPRPASSQSRTLSIASRAPSLTASVAPSLTPSLIQYIERDTMSPEPILGVAVLHKLSLHVLPSNENQDSHLLSETQDDRRSESSESPTSGILKGYQLPNKTKRRGMTSPPLVGLFTIPNITICKKRGSPSKSSPRSESTAGGESLANEHSIFSRGHEVEDKVDDMTSISLTESEWMCRTPSPVRNDPEHTRVERLRSPRLEKKKGSKNAVSKKAKDWYDNVRYSSSPEINPDLKFASDGVRIRSGNWI
ncbi:hypothetical protein B0O99DRAFT_686598 [Bisporella sp. PMI_857]|nr:hypothetical protein B0O99DRAFT_686598 [Bisporella sp. PMI_857]